MPRKFLEIENVPANLEHKVKQDLKFRTGVFVWRVKFNVVLDPVYVNNQTMYVANSAREPLKTSIRYDKVTNMIEIEPLEPYAQNEYYYLTITTNVRSKGGQHLKNPVEIKFKI